jgi:UDP-glucose 4-epimerase
VPAGSVLEGAVNVLVTGGLGAIGSFVSRLLRERGERVVVVDLRPDVRLVKDIADELTIVQSDILHLPPLIETFQKHRIDHVIHTAALMPDPTKRAPYIGTMVNVLGLTNVLEAARLTGVKRVVFASTRGVYAEATGRHSHPTYEAITEDYPKDPGSLYDASRFYGERLGRQYAETYGVEFCATRFSHTFGPGKLTHGTLAVPSQIIESAYRGVPIRVPQGADQKDDLIYNRDAALGLVSAASADNPAAGVYSIGTGRARSLMDVERAVRRHFPKAEIEIGPGLDFKGLGRDTYTVYDTTRARTELGFEAQFDIDAAVDDYLELLDRVDYFDLAPRLSPRST